MKPLLLYVREQAIRLLVTGRTFERGHGMAWHAKPTAAVALRQRRSLVTDNNWLTMVKESLKGQSRSVNMPIQGDWAAERFGAKQDVGGRPRRDGSS